MYYKILKNNQVIDTATSLRYVRLSPKSKKILLCPRAEANGIVAENGIDIWHLEGFYPFPEGQYETVKAIEISKDEYRYLTIFGGKTPEEIIDAYTMSLIEEGML